MDRTLDEIGLACGTDKASNHHDFLRFYERRLLRYRPQKFTLMEIGVYFGSSVKMWSEYFSEAQIVGLDINPDCVAYEQDRVAIRIGDASHPDHLFNIIQEFGRPLVVIDDGSHRWDHQILALQTLFPLLLPGGTFIMEDLDTSFEAHLAQAPFEGFSPISCFDYLCKLARCVSADAALAPERPYDLFINDWHRQVGTVEFGRRTAIITKKALSGGGSI